MKTKIIFLLLFSFVAINQVDGQKKNKKISVAGVVTDKNKMPVEGAMILVDEKNTSIVTDNKGFFKIKVKPDITRIGAFRIGVGQGETLFEGKPTINIVLDGSLAKIGNNTEGPNADEKVNIGYGTINKKDMAASDHIDNTGTKYVSYTNIYDMIKGEIPGVQVYGKKILIRGISSINSGTDPLFVVDGMVVESIDQISPRQVRSIHVLKGSEAAIYGSRGANGVILIELINSVNRK
jgi:TonB-dependent SusC/RagA subfamily outer membrane receptor